MRSAVKTFLLFVDFYLQTVSCTACGQQMNHFQWDAMYRHPALRVLICKVSFLFGVEL